MGTLLISALIKYLLYQRSGVMACCDCGAHTYKMKNSDLHDGNHSFSCIITMHRRKLSRNFATRRVPLMLPSLNPRDFSSIPAELPQVPLATNGTL